ncbi:hypothetical protein Ndes2526B_g04514 [Nannochloris sp. 'desiccata']
MAQGKRTIVVKKVTQAMLDSRIRRLDVGKLNIVDFGPNAAEGAIRIYNQMYSCVVRYQESRQGYFVTINRQEDYHSFFAINALLLGSSVAFEGFYDRDQERVYITARKVVNNEVVFVPSDEVTAPVVPSNNLPAGPSNNLPAGPLTIPGASGKAVRARRSPSKKAGACNDTRRVSSRLANKQQVAAFLFAAPSASISCNTKDGEVAGILAAMDQEEVDSAAPFEALALVAGEADVLQAAAVNASAMESLSPPRGDSPGVAGENKHSKEAVCAPQATLDTFFSARSSILGKRKAEEGEVDSLRDAAALQAEEDLEYQAQQFNAALDNAKAKLESLAATRLAREKKRRKVSHTALTAAAFNPSTAPARPPSSFPAGKGKKGPKRHGVAGKVATKKAAASGAGGTMRKTVAKSHFNSSVVAEDGTRKSCRIDARRLAAQAVTRMPLSRRKQAAPAPADLW